MDTDVKAMESATETQTSSGNLGQVLLIIIWILWTISFITVALRVFTKVHFVQGKMHIDDYLMCGASLSQLINNVLDTLAVKYGMGRHLSQLTAYQRQNALKYITLQSPFAVSSSALGRIAFAMYLLHLIGPFARIQKLALQAVITIQIILEFVVVVQIFSQCGPHLSALWDPNVAAIAHCQSPLVETYIGYVQSALNSICDVTLTVVPLFLIKTLSLNTRTKFGLAALLCLSVFAFTASLVKAVEIKALGDKNSYTWNMAYLTLCICIENNIVMIGASIPTLRPLLKWSKRNRNHSGPYSSERPTVGANNTRKGTPHVTQMARDGSSENIILKDIDNWGVEKPERYEITRTTDVSVTYIENRGEEGDLPPAVGLYD